MANKWILILSNNDILGNNDVDYCDDQGALEQVASEIQLGTSAILLLRSDLTKIETMKTLENLKWLVEQSEERWPIKP